VGECLHAPSATKHSLALRCHLFAAAQRPRLPAVSLESKLVFDLQE